LQYPLPIGANLSLALIYYALIKLGILVYLRKQTICAFARCARTFTRYFTEKFGGFKKALSASSPRGGYSHLPKQEF
jgi:hypothetical protein